MRKLSYIGVLLLAGFFWVVVHISVFAAEMRPNTLERIPLLTLSNPIWELTTLEMIDRTQSHAKFAEFPIAMDVKNFHEDTSLTVVSDAGWCQIVLLKTDWDQEHESMQSHIRGYGGWGYHEEKFRFPVGVEIGGYDGFFDPNQDHIYVCDSGNKRIVMLTYESSENNVAWAGSFGEDRLLCPQGVAYFDNHTEDRYDDIVFVTDMDNARVLYFSVEGQFLGAYDLSGHGLGQLSSPIGICRGSANTEWSSYFYVTDTYNFKVCCFRWYAGELQFVDELSFYDLPRSQLMGITTDYEGFVYVADRTRDRLLKISPSMNLVAIIDADVSPNYDFTEPIGLRFYDGALTVINKYSETSGFMCFAVAYLDTLRFDEDWTGLRLSLFSDLLVPCGRTLALGPGTHVSVAAKRDDKNLGIDPDRIELIVQGTLLTNGLANDSVFMYSDGTPAAPGDWYGVRVEEPCGYASVHYTCVQHAENAIEFSDLVNDEHHIFGYLADSDLRNNSVAGVYSVASILNVNHCLMRDNEVYGMYGHKSTANVSSSQFVGNKCYGIWMELEGPADSVRITNTDIDGENYPTSINGLYLSHPRARVEGCKVENYRSAAVLVSGYSPILKLDTLHNLVGMDCVNNAAPTLRYSKVWHATLKTGIHAASGSFPDLGLDPGAWGNNSIYSVTGTGYLVVNENLNSVFAQGNWWGTAPPLPWRFIGAVLWIPYLDHEPTPPPKTHSPTSLLPSAFFVSNSYPNPANPITRIDYFIPATGNLEVEVFNVAGQLVKTFREGMVEEGFHRLYWNGTNVQGGEVASGIYLFRFKYGDKIETRKVVLLR